MCIEEKGVATRDGPKRKASHSMTDPLNHTGFCQQVPWLNNQLPNYGAKGDSCWITDLLAGLILRDVRVTGEEFAWRSGKLTMILVFSKPGPTSRTASDE